MAKKQVEYLRGHICKGYNASQIGYSFQGSWDISVRQGNCRHVSRRKERASKGCAQIGELRMAGRKNYPPEMKKTKVIANTIESK